MELRERFRGALLGLAAGEAVGASVEFLARGAFAGKDASAERGSGYAGESPEAAMWERDAFDLLNPARIRFGSRRPGDLMLAAIQAEIDYRAATRDGVPRVEFSWQGSDDASAACGRGWAELRPGALSGVLYIHRGDESSFLAVKAPAATAGRTP